MGTDNHFEYAEKINGKELADYFLKLADGFRGNGMELQGKGQAIALHPEDSVKLEVKAKTKENEGELQLEISWKKEVIVSEEKLQVNPGAPEETEAV